MAAGQKVGYASASQGLLTDIDSLAQAGATNIYRQNPGTRQFDENGNEYIYLMGVASTVVGSCVTYGLNGVTAFQTALSVTGAKGAVAIALSATLAAQWGWYQIFGFGSALFNGAAVAGTSLYSASTGKVDDAVVSGDKIYGGWVAATVGSAVLGAVFLQYPSMEAND
jgi:hypothetical protein